MNMTDREYNAEIRRLSERYGVHEFIPRYLALKKTKAFPNSTNKDKLLYARMQMARVFPEKGVDVFTLQELSDLSDVPPENIVKVFMANGIEPSHIIIGIEFPPLQEAQEGAGDTAQK